MELGSQVQGGSHALKTRGSVQEWGLLYFSQFPEQLREKLTEVKVSNRPKSWPGKQCHLTKWARGGRKVRPEVPAPSKCTLQYCKRDPKRGGAPQLLLTVVLVILQVHKVEGSLKNQKAHRSYAGRRGWRVPGSRGWDGEAPGEGEGSRSETPEPGPTHPPSWDGLEGGAGGGARPKVTPLSALRPPAWTRSPSLLGDVWEGELGA